MKRTYLLVAFATIACLGAGVADAGPTLDGVKAKGFVQCGVNPGLAGFGAPDASGNWSGLDIDYCRAVAAAIFGDPNSVKFTPLSAEERFTALQSGEVDMLARNSTWTMGRDTKLGLDWAGVNYYDGQGFMVKQSLGVTSALQLGGATVCVQTGTTTELNLADYFRANGLELQTVVFENGDETVAAYDQGRCDAFTTDASGLYAERTKLANPAEHIVLPEIISKEPLGPVVRQGDDEWRNIVSWTHYALVNAEDLGITQANVGEMMASTNPEILRYLGVEGDFGTQLGLGNDWAANIIKSVGNYGEVFERNVGTATPLGIARGLNALWSKGGLQYGPPIR